MKRILIILIFLPFMSYGQSAIPRCKANIYNSDGTIDEDRTVTIDNGTFTINDNQLGEDVLNWDGSNWTIHADDVIELDASQVCITGMGQGNNINTSASYLAAFSNVNGCIGEFPVANLVDTDVSNVSANLTGTTLTIGVTEDGNTLTDNVDLSNLVSPPNLDNDPNNEIQTLNVTTELILVEGYSGRSSNGTTTQHVRNATMTRTAVGRWQVRFTGGTHPNGESYTVETQAEEQGNFRDTPDITIVQGTQNASGFDIQITTGDNGGTSDAYVDTPWSWGVERPINVVTDVTISN